MSVRLALLGAGAIGQKHAAAARAAGHDIKHVVDADHARAEDLAISFGATAGTDPSAIWNDSEVDAVVIGVPNHVHRQLASDAMQAGKDVLLEKPMAMTAAECDELRSIAEETQQVLQIGFAHRFTAVGKTAKQLVDAGDLGSIYHAKAHLHLKRGIPGLGRWFTSKAVSGGGVLIDVGVHLIDLSLYLLGHPAPSVVLGKTYGRFGTQMENYVYESMWAGPPDFNGVFDVEDSAHAMIAFDSGVSLDLQVCWAGNFVEQKTPVSQMSLLGDRAGMTFELFGDRIEIAGEQHGRLVETTVSLPEVDQMVEQMQAFGQAIADRKVTSGASADEGRTVQAIVDAIYQSSESGNAVTL